MKTFCQILGTELDRKLRDKTLCPVGTVEVAKLAEISGENCIPVTAHIWVISVIFVGVATGMEGTHSLRDSNFQLCDNSKGSDYNRIKREPPSIKIGRVGGQTGLAGQGRMSVRPCRPWW